MVIYIVFVSEWNRALTPKDQGVFTLNQKVTISPQILLAGEGFHDRVLDA